MAAVPAFPGSSRDVQLSAGARARLVYTLAARRASEYARSLVPTFGDQDVDPEDFITFARQHMLLSLALRDQSVLVAFARGATWEDIARRFGRDVDAVRGMYEERVRRWVANEPVPGGPALPDGSRPAGLPPDDDDAGPAAALELDEWFAHTCDQRDQEARRVLRLTGRRPVSGHLDP